MRRNRWAVVLAVTTTLAGGLTAPGFAGTPATSACPWVGSTAPVPQRVAQVLSRMSLDQKLLLLHQDDGAIPYVGNTPPIPELCVPGLTMSDGPSGVSNGMVGVTQLPAPITAAATWDPAAEQRYGAVVGAEEAGKGARVDLGPTVNITRDPRFGRAWETSGEDPYLSGKLGASEIRGVQSQGVMAQLKHFAVYNQELNRNEAADDAIISERAMQEIYLPQFATAFAEGAPSSTMCAYSMVNDKFACENRYLLQTVLRDQLHYPGFVTSDWGATHSTVDAANNGEDQDMQRPDDGLFTQPLKDAVLNGQVSRARIDEMTGRVLTQMFAFGLFDRNPGGFQDNRVTTPAHVTTGRQIAEEGSVLLKNSGAVLPLNTANTHSVAVIGDDADAGAVTETDGGTTVNAEYVVTPKAGIQTRAGAAATVSYAKGGSADGANLPDVPASVLTPSSGTGNGLTGEYYTNMTLSGTPALTKNNEGPIDDNWRAGSPGAGIGATGWSAKWTGTLTPPTTGTYTFSLTSDDGSRLLVDGKPVVDMWHDQGATTRTGTIALTAGKPVGIELDYYQNGGDDVMKFAWAPPGYQDPDIAKAAELAKKSDVAVVFAGKEEHEGDDLADIDLPGNQNELISAVAAANPKTIVVLNSGAAVTMPWLGSVAGVVEGWYAGQEDGNAVAALLFGDVNFSGKLPMTFPKSLADVPASTPQQWGGVDGKVQYSEGVDVGYRWYDTKGIAPLFPFGFGLSYTSFAFSNLRVSGLDRNGTATVTGTIRNTGSREGTDVVQLYVGDPAATGEPTKQLKGFQRVDLKPGASRQVSFPVTQHDLAYWGAGGWTTAAGSYGIMLGDTSATPQLTGTLQVPSSTHTPNTITVDNPQGMSSPVGAPVRLPAMAHDSAAGEQLRFGADGLPAGLAIDERSGVISGTARTAGTTTVTITATDRTGAGGSVTFVWTTTS